MRLRVIIGITIIVVFIIFGAYSFIETNVKYANISEAKKTGKTVQIVGRWLKDKGASYDVERNLFTFYLEDENGDVVKVIHHGPKPNNFEIATSIVVKGKYRNGVFESNQILTKCPSKYQSADELSNQN